MNTFIVAKQVIKNKKRINCIKVVDEDLLAIQSGLTIEIVKISNFDIMYTLQYD
jgi:hypothetical protein